MNESQATLRDREFTRQLKSWAYSFSIAYELVTTVV